MIIFLLEMELLCHIMFPTTVLPIHVIKKMQIIGLLSG